jgi:hypothetical protein
MARLGLLMLRQGKWKDVELMPKNWVQYLTTVYTPATELWPLSLRRAVGEGGSRWGYGALWLVWDAPLGTTSANWTDFTGSYTAMGNKNANIDVTPDQDVSASQY